MKRLMMFFPPNFAAVEKKAFKQFGAALFFVLLALVVISGCRHAEDGPSASNQVVQAGASDLVVKVVKQSPMAVLKVKLSIGGQELGVMEAGQASGATANCRLFSAPEGPYKLVMDLSTQNQNSVSLQHRHEVDLDGEPGFTDYVVISLGGPGDETTTRVGTFKIASPSAEKLKDNAAAGECTPFTEIRQDAENYALRAAVEDDVLVQTKAKAQSGDHEAQMQMARMYLGGAGVEKDAQKALDWALQAGNSGYIPAQMLLSAGYLKGFFGETDNPKAFAWAQKAAAQEDPKAMALLASYYKMGVGTSKDPEKAFEWFLKSAEKGHMVSQIVVGEAYYKGLGTAQDLTKAFEWRLKAAYGGSPAAANTVGQMYYRGEGVPRDLDKAFTWLQWAAERRSGNACATLGLMYFQGLGVEKDPAKAVEWFSKGAALGNILCMSNLGNCYLAGAGVEQDKEAAKQWLAKAGKKGYAPAINKLALIFLQEKDPQKAAGWAAVTAKAGNASGVYLLGLAQAQAGNMEKALETLGAAAKAGHKGAAEAIEKINVLKTQPVPEDGAPEIVPADPASEEE